MVSTLQSNTQGQEIPAYPDIQREIGENPARFLAEATLDVNADDPTMSLAYARIQGIDKWSVLNRWMKVERDIGPRDLVMRWLYDRANELEALGERPDRLEWPDGRPEHVDPETWTSSRDTTEETRTFHGSITTRTLAEKREAEKSEQQALGAWGDA